MMQRLSARPGSALLLVAAAMLTLQGCGIFRGGDKKPKTLGERVSVLDYEKLVEAEADLQGVEIALPTAQVNPSWTQPGGNASGNLGHLALTGTLARAWSVSVGKGSDATRRLNATPVIADNRLFVMDTEGRVSAFDAATGSPAWQRTIELEGEGRTPAFGGGVSVGDGRVFATTGFGIVVALDAGNGAELWRTKLPTPLRAAPGVDGSRVFVTTHDGQLSALSAETGAIQWQANATVEPAAILGPGAPSIALDTVVAGFPSGELFALRVENGRTAWQDQLSRTGRTTALGALSGIAASPVIDRGRVFAISHGGRMAALELSTGQRVWERDFAGVNTPWTAGDWVFAVTVEAQLVALTRADGKIRWVTQLERWKNEKKKTGGIEWFGPVLAGGRLLLVSSDDRLASVSPTTGEVQSLTDLNAPAYLPPVVANGMLYILTDDGTLTAYR
jgi:outer membrane protein assembly factor BamB